MMKKLSFFVLLLGAFILFSSCLYIPKTYKTYFDINTPEDQTTTIKFVGDFWLREWDGTQLVPVYPGTLTIPAGNTRFLFNLSFTHSNRYSTYTYRFNNIDFQYVFEPGKVYTIKGEEKLVGLIKGYDFFIRLYDTTKGSVLLNEWKLERESN